MLIFGKKFLVTTAPPPYPWQSSRPYNAGSDYIRRTFGQRVQKVSIDAGFTCPNRDGTKGYGGCTFCNNDSFNPSYCQPNKSIRQQIEEGIAFHARRYRRSSGYFAYFQAYSNTHAPIEMLEQRYNEALACDGILGLIIGTRPDCIDAQKLDLLESISKTHYVSVEYGIESTNDESLRQINRGHTFAEARQAVVATADRSIATGAHFIIGLPGEGLSHFMQQADIISELPLHSVKFHQLQIIRNTQMASQYLANPQRFTLLSAKEYLQIMVNITERLRPSLIIDRIAGESPPEHNLLPSWGMRYDVMIQQFEQLLNQQQTWQGKHYTESW